MAGRFSQYLADDHRRLDALLKRAFATPEGRVDTDAWQELRTGLLRHIAVEEKLLMPALRQRHGELSWARRLRVDHGALALLLVPSPTPELAAEIESILVGHNAVEEDDGGLYALADALPADEVERLLARARAYPEVKVTPHYDGAGVFRTAAAALAFSGRQRQAPMPLRREEEPQT